MSKELAYEYFKSFSARDLTALASMFDNHVTLRDWSMSASGKTAVVAANKDIFEAVDSIDVTILAVYQDGDTVIAEIKIHVVAEQDETLLVTDIITFKEGKITSIRAYRG